MPDNQRVFSTVRVGEHKHHVVMGQTAKIPIYEAAGPIGADAIAKFLNDCAVGEGGTPLVAALGDVPVQCCVNLMLKFTGGQPCEA